MSTTLRRGRGELLCLAATAATAVLCSGLRGIAIAQSVAQQDAATCFLSGTVTAGGLPLPGVSIVASAGDGANDRATSTGPGGAYRLPLPSPGAYDVTFELPGFAPALRVLNLAAVRARPLDNATLKGSGPNGCPTTLNVSLTLESRAAAEAVAPVPELGSVHGPQVAAAGQPAQAHTATAGRQRPGVGAGWTRVPPAAAGTDQVDVATKGLLPPGFSPDAATESVAATGTAGQTNEAMLFGMGPGRPGDAFGLAGDPRDMPGGAVGMPSGALAPQGVLGRGLASAPGGPGGPGAFGPGGFGRGMAGANRVRLTAFYVLGGSPLDSAPYPLTDQPAQKPDYLSQRFGVVAGGPLGIPGVFDRNKTSFFFNYTGNHSSTASTSYSTVPTAAERAGDLSALSTPIMDPTTGRPFAGNVIPPARVSPTATALLNLYPLPNLAGAAQNFQFATTAATSLDDINFRLVRNLGSGGPPGGMGGMRMLMGGGGPAPTGIRNLSIGVHYHRSVGTTPGAFPGLGSTAEAHAWDVPVNYAFSAWGMLNFAHARYNRNATQTLGSFAFTEDVAGNAGIASVSTDPFDWNTPSLSFSSFSPLRGVAPSQRIAQTIDVGHTMFKLKGRHSIRFGGDYRAYFTDSRLDTNAAGSFVFTGLYTSSTPPVAKTEIAPGTISVSATGQAGSGADFADFLLGMPQQATVQYGPGLERFRGRSWDLFVQDDWRIASKVTLSLGARYEFVSPFWESAGRLVTLDVNRDFTAAVPVQAGGTGPFSGPLPSTLIKPDYGDIAPRVGVAWRATDRTVVRAGYGINYNAGLYQAIAQSLASQPPFAVAATTVGTALAPLSLTNALQLANPDATTNTFAVDPAYHLGRVQVWNVDVQRSIGRTVVVDVAYIGTRGADLDLQRAPNRGPAGLRIPNVQPFIFEASQATSTMNALSLRLQKRLSSGLSASASYVYSRAYDDASTISGGTVVVAQNDQDLAAEWAPSSFDQPHRLTASFTYDLPFGPSRRWANGDSTAAWILRGWQVAGTVSIASGLPFTPRVVGAPADVATGVNGTLRADVTGVPIALADPGVVAWFNTAAFVVPPAGVFGNAGRNSLRGPTTKDLDLSLAKDIPLGGERGLNIRLQALNVFNIPQFTVIDTVVNSPTFGRVIGVQPMRTVQIVTRFRF